MSAHGSSSHPPQRHGTASAPRHLSDVAALWRLPYAAALLLTIPAFYLSLNAALTPWPMELYGACTGVAAARLLHLLTRISRHRWAMVKALALDLLLAVALAASALLPASSSSEAALAWRMVTALLILLRLVGLFRGLFTQTSLVRLLALSALVLVACGAGFYWLDPAIKTLEDGLWLAFITAATVGYGDVVPTTTASRIFSVFVVLLGCGVLSLVTASVAAMFMRTQERQLERDILHEMHREVKALRDEVAALRREAHRGRGADGTDRAGSAANAAHTDGHSRQ